MAASPAVDVPPSPPPPLSARARFRRVSFRARCHAVRMSDWRAEGRRERKRNREKRTIGHPSRSGQPPAGTGRVSPAMGLIPETPQYRTLPNAASRHFDVDSCLNKPIPSPQITLLRFARVACGVSPRPIRSEPRVRDSLQIESPWPHRTVEVIFLKSIFLNDGEYLLCGDPFLKIYFYNELKKIRIS